MSSYGDKVGDMYASTNSSHANLIARDFQNSRVRSTRRHNAHIIVRRERKRILRDSSMIGLAVVLVLGALDFLRVVFGGG